MNQNSRFKPYCGDG